MTTSMSIVISTPTSSLFRSFSSGGTISSLCSLSNSTIAVPKTASFQHIKCVPQLGLTPFSQWNGLKNVGVLISQYSVKMDKKGKRKSKGVYASLFGVGAPEVLVIGVVALLVFGPKGLAEVARNLGKTLRAFQPTIRELQEVSREFKSTLEREIGLDDIDNPNPVPKSSSSNTTEPKPGANIEPNGSTVEESRDDALNQRADRFRGALAALQKEQEEERQQKEQQLQAQVEPQTTSQDTSEAPEEASSDTSSQENPQSDSLQEAAAAVAPTGSAESTETQNSNLGT